MGPAASRSLPISRAAWALAGLLATVPLLSLQTQSPHPTTIAGIAALALLTGFRPLDALLLYSGLAPLATILVLIIEPEGSRLRLIEAATLALLAGWSARRAVLPRPLAVIAPLRWSVAILIAASLASLVVSAAILVSEDPGASAAAVLRPLVIRDYLVSSNPLTFALQFAEGLALVLLAADICAGDEGKRDRILRMMVMGASAAAVFNLLRITFLAVAREEPWQAFAIYFATVRVNVHFMDWNAAGSYFAMMFLIAAGFMGRPAFGVPCAILTGAALWLTGSRTAIVAALIIGPVVAMLALRSRVRSRVVPIVAVVSVLLCIALAIWKWYPQGRNERMAAAWSYRVLTVTAGLKLTESNPVFGVGLGRFASMAGPFVGMAQNAHNNYVQVMAELGVPGLVLFVGVIASALKTGFSRAGPPGPSWGLLAGLGAYLLTCLGGHPLLIVAAAYPFWTALGLAASAPPVEAQPSRAIQRVIGVLTVLILVTLPFRIASARDQANVEHASIGFSKWQRQPDGSRFRWAGGRSTFFVPSTARAVRIPLRQGTDGPAAVEVRIILNGREANRVALETGADWRTLRLVLARDEKSPFSRIDLEAVTPGSLVPVDATASDTGGVLMVGRPFVEE